jgi:ABC-type transporter Mla subunit MlaD
MFGRMPKASHVLHLQTHFIDGNSIKAGAVVRVAGVDVGRVTSVVVRPELKASPVEVKMTIATPYELTIPEDSIVRLQSSGLLGETYPEISISETKGRPAKDGAELASRETKFVSAEETVDKLKQLADRAQRLDGARKTEK